MVTAHQIAAALGGAETFGGPIGSVEELRLRVREGIPYPRSTASRPLRLAASSAASARCRQLSGEPFSRSH